MINHVEKDIDIDCVDLQLKFQKRRRLPYTIHQQ